MPTREDLMTTDDDTPRHGFPALGWALPAARAPGDGTPRAHVPEARDDTTRYLCAAVHMDEDYADRAIREFLLEGTRPVPASPGVDAAAVLGEAVAARTRRKLRDIPLFLLMAGFVALAPTIWWLAWILYGALVSVASATTAVKRRSRVRSAVYIVGGLLVIGVVTYFAPQMLDWLGGSSSAEEEESISAGVMVGAIMLVVAMLAVVLADRFAVWRHLDERFWPNRPTVSPWLRDRPVFQFSSRRQLGQLGRHVDPRPTMAAARTSGMPVPLVVYRNFVPFVGAGVPEKPWSIAVPLEDLPDAEPTAELTTESLYNGIRAELESLRAASVLAPGRRLDELSLGEVVIVSSDELVDHLADPTASDFLQAPGVAPFTMIRRERAEAIKADPLEWARYYQRYQVETWDRDLVVTVFVHVAVGQGALYVEWTPCVLRPIRKKYRDIDKMRRSVLRAVGRALVDLMVLPVTLPGRSVRTFSFLRALPRERGLVVPEMYGASESLRELAADTEVHNYFQLADVDRYLKMMESRLVLAVSRMMHAAGYSPASFDKQAAAVVNNNVKISGSVSGDVVVGSGNKVGATTAPRPE